MVVANVIRGISEFWRSRFSENQPLPTTPGAGQLVLYGKTNGANVDLVLKDEAGTEIVIATMGTGSGLGYTPLVPADWELPVPVNVGGALDRTAAGRAGVCLISAIAPTNPAIGQMRLDRTASGASGMGVVSVITITSNLTLTSSHTEVGCDATSGPITTLLPVAASSAGRLYLISKIDGTGNAVIVDGNGALIIGSSRIILASQHNAGVFVCDGAGWRIY